MEQQNKKEMDTSRIVEHEIVDDPKAFWKKYFVELILAFLLIISVGWGYFGKKNTIKRYENEISNLTENHDTEIKELKAEHIRQLSSTLALAIRSEMIAENMNQIDQYFIQTIKMFNIERILLVNPKTSEVILSTNKKDQGELFESETLVKTNEAIKKTYNSNTYVATPIMGLNTQLGVLILQID